MSTFMVMVWLSPGWRARVLSKPQSTLAGFPSFPCGAEQYICTTSLPGVLPVFFTFTLPVTLSPSSLKSEAAMSKLVYDIPNPNGKRTLSFANVSK